MGYEVLQSNWFWPTIGISLAGYYGWVLLTYFRSVLTLGIGQVKTGSPEARKNLSLSWDDLAMGFAIHRRLLTDPQADLDPDERALLGKSPFKELIQQTTIK